MGSKAWFARADPHLSFENSKNQNQHVCKVTIFVEVSCTKMTERGAQQTDIDKHAPPQKRHRDSRIIRRRQSPGTNHRQLLPDDCHTKNNLSPEQPHRT